MLRTYIESHADARRDLSRQADRVAGRRAERPEKRLDDFDRFHIVVVREVIGETAERSAEEMCSAVVASLQKFGGGRPYNDDVTLVVLNRGKADPLQ